MPVVVCRTQNASHEHVVATEEEAVKLVRAYAATGLFLSVGILEDEEQTDDDHIPGEDMDGDHDSAMTSAGMGTDEDYGFFDEY
jgi:hypothetical protein